jgi:hypothetical protein
MGEMLAFPFRLGPSGHLVTVDDTSDEGTSQLIAAAVLTRPGERPLYPTFGIPDPTFNKLVGPNLAAVLAQYGPAIQITSVDADFTDSITQQVTINYQEQALAKS